MDILRAHIAEAQGPRQSSRYRHVPDSEGAGRFSITWLAIFARRLIMMELDTGWQAITIAI